MIDGIIGQTDKNFLKDLIIYKKTLAQRNALLKMNHQKIKFDVNVLDIYDESLINLGNMIYEKRKAKTRIETLPGLTIFFKTLFKMRIKIILLVP